MLFQQQGCLHSQRGWAAGCAPWMTAAGPPCLQQMGGCSHLRLTMPDSPWSQHQWLAWKLGPQHLCHGWEEGARQSLKEYSMSCSGRGGVGRGTGSLAVVLPFNSSWG